MSAWRTVGLTYINYSTIAAKVLRKSLKPVEKLAAEKRDVTSIRFTSWENGKAIKDSATK